MRSKFTKGLLTKTLLVASLMFGVMTLTGTTANAQHFHHGRVVVRPRVFVYPRTFYPRSFWYGYGYYPYNSYYSTHVTGGQGYEDGVEDGRHDAKHNKGYNPYSHNDYKNAVTTAYTENYLRGYADGFGRNG